MKRIDDIEAPAGGGNREMGWTSDVAAELLQRLGLRYVAINPGASYRGLHDSIVNYLGNRDPQMLLCLHEDHVVSLAHGYARVTDEPMGCILHSNVGLMHGLMNIYNAWCNRVPMLVIGATGPVDAATRRPWIEWIHTSKDQGALLRSFVKWDDEPRSVDALMESLCRAMALTRSAPKAPVYICLDVGLQEQALEQPATLPDVSRYAPPAPPVASADVVSRTVEMLTNAERPLIMIGRTSRKANRWKERLRLAELLDADVVTDLKTGAAFPTDHRLHADPPVVKKALAAADVVLALDWVDLAGTFQSAFGHKDKIAAKVITCSLDAALHNGWSMDLFGLPPADLGVTADPEEFVGQLVAALEMRGFSASPRQHLPKAAAPAGKSDPAAPITFADIGRALEATRRSGPLTLAHLPIGGDAAAIAFQEPLDFIGQDGGGGLGAAPGSAIGASLGLQGQGRRVVSVLGDGDFLQGATALWTAAHYRIPVLWIIANNRSNFNDELHQQTMAKRRSRPIENRWIGQRIDDPAVSFVDIARGQGVAGEGPLESVAELDGAMVRALDRLDAGEPYLLDIHIAPSGQGA